MKGQNGFTILEFTVAIAVVAVVLGALTNIVYRAGQGVDASNTQIKVFRAIEDAASFVGGDVNMAKYTTLLADDSVATTAAFEWTDFYNDQNFGHRASYSLSGGNLVRDYDGIVNTVAKGVTSVSFSRGTVAQGKDRLVTVTITVSGTEGPEQFTETRTYRFNLRPQT